MLELAPNKNANEPLTILCLGAHCDDIEIGCGALLLTLLSQRKNIRINWCVFTSTPSRKKEAETAAEAFCAAAASLDVRIFDFRDGFLPYEGEAVKTAFETLKPAVNPDLILTHYRADLHQDHRIISELTWNTFRDHLILEYEIPKWDGDIGNPNFYFPVANGVAKEKISLIRQSYRSQSQKAWFTDDLFQSLLRLRGMECNAPDKLAEAFYVRKAILR